MHADKSTAGLRGQMDRIQRFSSHQFANVFLDLVAKTIQMLLVAV